MAKKNIKKFQQQPPQVPKIIKLLKPARAKDTSVFVSLKSRKTTRLIGDKKLSLQELSNILWAAGGVNRAKGPFGDPGLTAASASNSREIDVYAFLEDGIYLYEPSANRLVLEAEGDFRSMAIGKGQLSSGSRAPLRLVYIADIDKFSQAGFQEPGLHDTEIQKAYYYVDTGIIAGNVYLYAASQGLASWFHNCDRAGIAAKLNLRPGQRVLFGQTIGYPEKGK